MDKIITSEYSIEINFHNNSFGHYTKFLLHYTSELQVKIGPKSKIKLKYLKIQIILYQLPNAKYKQVPHLNKNDQKTLFSSKVNNT